MDARSCGRWGRPRVRLRSRSRPDRALRPGDRQDRGLRTRPRRALRHAERRRLRRGRQPVSDLFGRGRPARDRPRRSWRCDHDVDHRCARLSERCRRHTGWWGAPRGRGEGRTGGPDRDPRRRFAGLDRDVRRAAAHRCGRACARRRGTSLCHALSPRRSRSGGARRHHRGTDRGRARGHAQRADQHRVLRRRACTGCRRNGGEPTHPRCRPGGTRRAAVLPNGSSVSRVDGKHVVVTGAARGIGRAIVEAFLHDGASVVAIDVLRDELDVMRSEQSAPSRVEVIPVDLADPDAARAAAIDAIARAGRVDALVNCAGIMTSGPILDMPVETFDRTIAVNTRAPLITMQTIGAHMAEHGGGAIVNVASANAFKNESPEAAYNASKAALVALTKAMAHELAHRNIRANCIAPGQTITKEKGARTETDPEQARIQREYLQRIPMRRAGRPSEQAAAVLFLASNDASFVNGETLIVDGGELGGGDWYDHALAPTISED